MLELLLRVFWMLNNKENKFQNFERILIIFGENPEIRLLIVETHERCFTIKTNNQELLIRKQNESDATSKWIEFQKRRPRKRIKKSTFIPTFPLEFHSSSISWDWCLSTETGLSIYYILAIEKSLLPSRAKGFNLQHQSSNTICLREKSPWKIECFLED